MSAGYGICEHCGAPVPVDARGLAKEILEHLHLQLPDVGKAYSEAVEALQGKKTAALPPRAHIYLRFNANERFDLLTLETERLRGYEYYVDLPRCLFNPDWIRQRGGIACANFVISLEEK